MAGIYLRQGETYVAMSEAPFDAELVPQALIAQHAEVLGDETGGKGPFLLVRREAPISDPEDAGGRFSLDHLYVDGQGVPTLVEVKRSSGTRGRAYWARVAVPKQSDADGAVTPFPRVARAPLSFIHS
jgi:hypothetical protein